jgi:hypothetical protein
VSGIQVAVSTSSCPHLSAVELAEAVLGCGADGVELRVDRSHAWETDGVEAVVSAGLAITAIAGSRTLGAEAGPGTDKDVAMAATVGSRLRCFLDDGCDREGAALRRAGAQVGALQWALGEPAAVVIELYPGKASLSTVRALCAETGAGVVLDTLALSRLGITLRQALDELGAATRVLHLKGFERDQRRGWRHRPLTPADLPPLAAVAVAPELASVVVETKAASTWRDLRLLGEWMREERP